MKKFTGVSLFASAGIAELNLKPYINFVVANELIPARAKLHEYWHPNAEMICGDITRDCVKNKIISKAKNKKVDFILATPPCQGVSLIGKNKRNEQFLKDDRNFLIFHALDVVDAIAPNVVVIENVDRFSKMLFPFNDGYADIDTILRNKYSDVYNVHSKVYNAADFGVPQSRKRLIIVMTKKDFVYSEPQKIDKQITVREAIGELPSLESGETSFLKHHNAKKHPINHVLCMKHTSTGKSAFQNDVYFPKKQDGSKIVGYPYTYKRIDWDKPAPTITMRSDTISTTHSVHPGRKKDDGTYSDARVLTLRELFVLSSINPEIDIPDYITENQVRYCIGEAVPPLLMEAICKNIKEI